MTSDTTSPKPVVLDVVDDFNPDWAIHPGRQLAEYLEVHGWSQAECARRTGLSRKLVSTIIAGKNPVTPATARKLEAVFGLNAEIWLGFQSRWDLFQETGRPLPVQDDESREKSALIGELLRTAERLDEEKLRTVLDQARALAAA